MALQEAPMEADVRELIEAALKLPPEARGAIASRLLDSLQDEEVDTDVEAAWDAEIARRVAELDSGQVKTIPWSEARRHILRDE
ncbi:MAG: addiction module protein [Candidatus Eisenbacteria bacterium]